MRSPGLRWIAFAVAVAAVVVAPVVLRSQPRPYVVTAIDYHFHDAHPTAPIAPGRDLVVTNQGRNVHNVTVTALAFSHDVEPGGRVSLGNIADRLEPGRYQLVCRIHEDRGMTGVLVVAAS